MPFNRQIDNTNLIRSSSQFADIYVYRVADDGIQLSRRPKLIQTFKLRASVLENLVQVFYNSELDPGFWSNLYEIDTVTISGTIHGNFFYHPPTDLQTATTFLLNIYNALFRNIAGIDRDDELRRQYEGSIAFLYAKFETLAEMLGGSTRAPFEIMDKINQRTFFNNDFIRLEYHVNYDATRGPLRPIAQLVVDDNVASIHDPYEPQEDIERILRLRLENDAVQAAAAEDYDRRDELFELRRQYNRPDDILDYRAHYSPADASDNDSVSTVNRMRVLPPAHVRQAHQYNLRPRLPRHLQGDRVVPPAARSVYNLRNRAQPRQTYTRFLNRTDRHRRNRRIARGIPISHPAWTYLNSTWKNLARWTW